MTDAVRIFAPLLAWLAFFTALYGLHGLGCGLGWPDVAYGGLSVHRAVLLAAWVAALAAQWAILGALSRRWPAEGAFVRTLSVTLSMSALVAAGWTLFPVLFASSCT